MRQAIEGRKVVDQLVNTIQVPDVYTPVVGASYTQSFEKQYSNMIKKRADATSKLMRNHGPASSFYLPSPNNRFSSKFANNGSSKFQYSQKGSRKGYLKIRDLKREVGFNPKLNQSIEEKKINWGNSSYNFATNYRSKNDATLISIGDMTMAKLHGASSGVTPKKQRTLSCQVRHNRKSKFRTIAFEPKSRDSFQEYVH